MPTEKEYLAKKALLEQKQDKLIAGSGIYIDENTNTISATGGSGNVDDVKVNGVSVVDLEKVAQINLTPYATTSAMNTALAAKQDTLVPGTNINIDPNTNVISASTGASSLDDLTNVDITTPADGDALVYDATNQKWVNGAGGGGTTVVPNPVGEPAAILNTIGINNIIYDIPGSGSGGGTATIRDTLWTGLISSVGATGTLTKSFSNYDYLLIYGVVTINNSNPEHHIAIVDAQRLKDELDTNNIAYFSYEYYDTQYIRCKFTTETAFDCTEKYGDYSFDTIVGIKLGGGDAVDDILYTDTTGTTGIQTITLNQRLDSYEAIYFEFYFPAETTYVEANPSPLQMLIETPAGATNKYLLQSYPSYGNRYILLTSADGGKTATLTTSAWGEGTYPSIYRIHGVRFGGTGGGADVEANPQDTPTDTLNTIRIGETVYDIAGSGGGSEGTYSTTLLWNYIDDNSGIIDYGVFNYTLNDNINNYDSLVIENVSASGDLPNVDWNATNIFSIDVNALNNSLNSNYINYTSFSDRSSRYYIKDTTFQKTINNQGNTNGLVNVYGIKYGGNASNKGDLLYVAPTVAGAPVGTAQNYLTNRSFKDYDLITIILSDTGDTGGGSTVLSPASFVPNSLVNIDGTGDYALCMTGYGNRYTNVSFQEHTFTVTAAAAVGEDASHIQSIYKMYGFKFTGNSGGGTDVEANPTDTPTDTLNTIRIGDTVYDIAGTGGGSGSATTDVLYQASDSGGAALNTQITYDDGKHLSDYDLCYVYLTVTASGDATLFESHSFCPKNQPRQVFRVTGYGNRFTNIEMTDTDFTVIAETGESWEYTYKVYTILGMKLGGGSGDNAEIIPISAGDGTNSRTFTFDRIPKKISMQYVASGWGFYRDIIWGTDRSYYQASQAIISDSVTYTGVSGIVCDETTKSITITGLNAIQAGNTADIVGYMFVDYGGGSGDSSKSDISDMTWTQIISQAGGAWSTATAIPSNATHVAVVVDFDNKVYMPQTFKLSDWDKYADILNHSLVEWGFDWKVGSSYDTIQIEYDSTNRTVRTYAGYNGLTIKTYALS